MRNLFVNLTLASSVLLSAQAYAGASANVGVTSNYVWRGVTQTDEKPALQIGADYAHDSGAYIGTWASNVKFPDAYDGVEADVYAGYKKDLKGDVFYDVGAIRYAYPSEDTALDFTEVYAKAGIKGLTGEVAYTVDKEGTSTDEGDIYYALGYGGAITEGLNYGIKVGHTDYKADAADDYTHYQLSLSKGFDKFGDLTLAVDDSDLPDTDPMPSVTWKKTFEF